MKKDNKEYLMKRRRYGWGWTPTSWQTWLMLVLQFVILLTTAMFLPAKPAQPTNGELVKFFVIVACVVATIILLGLLTGPSPKWRWGKKDSDDPDEDF